jgi:oligopeptide/dipeptide ABC transporter ATP-binding protein
MNEQKEVILRVKDLRISFRTVSGKVQAVRGISFNLIKGETLAIVGESGSGKSVTNRAIMGILAKNGIIESGEVLYDGRDLLKISEEEFCRIRGDKIAMIFQDPLSSLNPIIKIGRQLTEATLLKNKANQRDAKEALKNYLTALEKVMGEVHKDDPDAFAKDKKFITDFQAFSKVHLENQVPFNNAYSALNDASEDLSDMLFNTENKVAFDLKEIVSEFLIYVKKAKHPFVLADEAKVDNLSSTLKEQTAVLLKDKKNKDYSSLLPVLNEFKAMFDAVLAAEKPDFFAYGYYNCFVEKEFPASMSVHEKNEKAQAALVRDFIKPFEAEISKALRYSHESAINATKLALEALKAKRSVYTKDELVKDEVKATTKELVAAVRGTIDPLALVKDSYSYTFDTAMNEHTGRYFRASVINAKEEKRFAKQQAKYDALVKKNKTPDWKPVPANVVPHDLLVHNITAVIDNLIEVYTERIAHGDDFNANELALKIVPSLKEKASLSVYNVTKSMAKTMAIKLMKEVGIAEPRKRFKQYPFEFSGGMRQRIVIAIALAANPEILICDEPTTALDVTIQAQILELINKIKEERKLSVIFITHNLGVVANMADKIAVMYAGKIVEFGTADDIFYEPCHPYTWALLASMPDLETKEKLDAIPGTPPNMIYPPKGDAFAPRNKYALNIDFKVEPPLFQVSPTHYAATWLCDPRAPKVQRPKVVDARIAQMKAKYGAEIKEELAANEKAEPDEAYVDIAVPLDFAVKQQEEDSKKGAK